MYVYIYFLEFSIGDIPHTQWLLHESNCLIDLIMRKDPKRCHSNSALTSLFFPLLPIAFNESSALLCFQTSVRLWIAIYLCPEVRPCVLNLHPSMLLSPAVWQNNNTSQVLLTFQQDKTHASQRKAEKKHICGKRKRVGDRRRKREGWLMERNSAPNALLLDLLMLNHSFC